MSGSSAGVECTNPLPDEQEKAAVEQTFSSVHHDVTPHWSDRELVG